MVLLFMPQIAVTTQAKACPCFSATLHHGKIKCRQAWNWLLVVPLLPEVLCLRQESSCLYREDFHSSHTVLLFLRFSKLNSRTLQNVHFSSGKLGSSTIRSVSWQVTLLLYAVEQQGDQTLHNLPGLQCRHFEVPPL